MKTAVSFVMENVGMFIKKPGMKFQMALIAIWFLVSCAFGVNSVIVDLIMAIAIVSLAMYLKKSYYKDPENTLDSFIKYFLNVTIVISAIIFVMGHLLFSIIALVVAAFIWKRI